MNNHTEKDAEHDIKTLVKEAYMKLTFKGHISLK